MGRFPVQMEVYQFEGAQWRSSLSKAFVANMVVKPFKWAGKGVILLELKVNKVVAKAVYNPGCARANLCNNF